MNVYLAARWERQREMQRYRLDLHQRGHQVRARWLDVAASHSLDGPDLAASAYHCLADIAQCELFILFTEAEPISRNGRMVELGYALALQQWGARADARGQLIAFGPHRMVIAVVGPAVGVEPRENLFCYGETVNVYETWPRFMDALNAAPMILPVRAMGLMEALRRCDKCGMIAHSDACLEPKSLTSNANTK